MAREATDLPDATEGKVALEVDVVAAGRAVVVVALLTSSLGRSASHPITQASHD